jgi:hypothetical protein
MSAHNLLLEAQKCYEDYLKQLKILQACKNDFDCFVRESFETWRRYADYDTARQQYESFLSESAGAGTPAPPPPSQDPGTLENVIREIFRKQWRPD